MLTSRRYNDDNFGAPPSRMGILSSHRRIRIKRSNDMMRRSSKFGVDRLRREEIILSISNAENDDPENIRQRPVRGWSLFWTPSQLLPPRTRMSRGLVPDLARNMSRYDIHWEAEILRLPQIRVSPIAVHLQQRFT